MKNGHFI